MRGRAEAVDEAPANDVATGVGQQEIVERGGAAGIAEEGADLASRGHGGEPVAVPRQVGEVARGQALKLGPRLRLAAQLAVEPVPDAAAPERHCPDTARDVSLMAASISSSRPCSLRSQNLHTGASERAAAPGRAAPRARASWRQPLGLLEPALQECPHRPVQSCHAQELRLPQLVRQPRVGLDLVDPRPEYHPAPAGPAAAGSGRAAASSSSPAPRPAARSPSPAASRSSTFSGPPRSNDAWSTERRPAPRVADPSRHLDRLPAGQSLPVPASPRTRAPWPGGPAAWPGGRCPLPQGVSASSRRPMPRLVHAAATRRPVREAQGGAGQPLRRPRASARRRPPAGRSPCALSRSPALFWASPRASSSSQRCASSGLLLDLQGLQGRLVVAGGLLVGQQREWPARRPGAA